MRSAALLTSGLVLAAAVSAPLASAAAAPAGPVSGPDPAGGVIVVWEDGTNGGDRTDALRRVGLSRGERLPLVGGELAEAAPGQAADLAARLADDPAVAFAEPDVLVRTSTNDPGWPLQWGLDNTGQNVQGVSGTPDVDIDAQEAWALAGPTAPVTVAVLDTGVDLAHPDLAGSAWVNADEVPGNGLDDDANGYADDVHGWDWVNSDSSVYDAADGDQHGTHVAGTIGATPDNGLAFAGVSRSVRLMSLKIIGPETGSTSNAIKAIAYAKANGAAVLNASWGGQGFSKALSDAIASSGLLFVAAAGNGGTDKTGDDAETTPDYPAALRLPNLVSVAAIESTGALAPYSNFGDVEIDVAAPGSSIASTVPGGGVGWMSGTSMATPHVSGVGAMLAAAGPTLSGAQLAALLKGSAVPLPSLAGKTVTGGLVNGVTALTALAAMPGPTPSPTPTACPTTLPGAGFQDVDPGSVHAPRIDCAAWWGIVLGSSATEYAPSKEVTRGQMALFLSRIVGIAGVEAAGSTSTFDDVRGTRYEQPVALLHALGIVQGTNGTTYSPERSVTRAQMASFLVRLHERISGSALATGGSPFTDLPEGVHAVSIDKAFTAGIARGISATEYGPARLVRRDQMASFLMNEVDLLVRTGGLAPRS